MALNHVYEDFNNESTIVEQNNYFPSDNNLSRISYARRVLASCTEVGMEDLLILGTIKPGDTICVSTLSIVVHRSWSAWIWRTALRESRDKTKVAQEDSKSDVNLVTLSISTTFIIESSRISMV